MSMWRSFIIAAIVLVVGGGIATYFYFFSNSPGITVAPPGSVSLPTAGQGAIPGGRQTSASGVAAGLPASISARLVRVSAGPIVPGEGITHIPAADASSTPETRVSFIEQRSGNVFSYLARTRVLTRTSSRTVPGIVSASWVPDASLAFVRYLSGDDFSTINTYALPADSSGNDPGFFLPQNLSGIAVSSTSVLSLSSGVNGSVTSLQNIDGSRSSEIFTTPLSALRVAFAGKNQYLAFTKPSAFLPGNAFLVDGTGHFSRVAGPRNGLVALASPFGTFVLVSYTLGSAMQMELVNAITGETISLPVATIADKCVWASDESAVYCGVPVDPPLAYAYPDDWYQGAVHFSDRIWKIDVAGRFAQLILDFSTEIKEPLDAEALALDSVLTTLVFVNKNNGSLWSYSL